MGGSSTQTEEIIAGLPTQFLLSSYENGALLVVTQLGKLGTLVEANAHVTLDGKVSSFSTRPLLCDRGEGAEALARVLCEEGCIKSRSRRLILALALVDGDPSPNTFRAILDVVGRLWDTIEPKG